MKLEFNCHVEHAIDWDGWAQLQIINDENDGLSANFEQALILYLRGKDFRPSKDVRGKRVKLTFEIED